MSPQEFRLTPGLDANAPIEDALDFTSTSVPAGALDLVASEASPMLAVFGADPVPAAPAPEPLGGPVASVEATSSALSGDMALAIAASNGSTPEGTGVSTPFSFSVTRTGDLSTVTTVDWATSGVGAAPVDAADFVGGALPFGTVTFAIGESIKLITVQVSADSIVEASETLQVVLSAPSGGATLATAAAFGTILNDDIELSITAASARKPEGSAGSTSFTFGVVRTGDLSTSTTVNWATSGVGAFPADAADFVGGLLPAGTMSFAIGESIKLIIVKVAADAAVEFNETFQVVLSAPSDGATLAAAAASSVILNDDASYLVADATADQAEGNAGSNSYVFTVHRNGDLRVPGTVDFAVAGSGMNPANAEDFIGGVLPAGTLDFLANETSKTVTVAVAGDTTAEANERFSLELNNPHGGTVTVPSLTRTIISDDASLSIGVLSASNLEGLGSDTPFTFLVTRNGGISVPHSATWSVGGVTELGDVAASEGDFAGGILPSGTVHFAAGETSRIITVNVAADALGEPNERFAVTLANPSTGATITTASAQGEILDDDHPLSVVPAGTARAEGNGGGATGAGFLITRTADLEKATTVNWSVVGTGASPVDAADFAGGVLPEGSTVFAPGQGSQVVMLQIAADGTYETAEDLQFAISGTVAGQVFTDAAIQTVLNDDAPAQPVDPHFVYIDPTAVAGGDGSIDRPYLSFNDVTIQAGDMVLLRGGTVSQSFAITSQGRPDRPIVIGSYGEGTARVAGRVVLSGAQYVAVTDLDIEPGDGYGVVLANGTAFSTVKNCSIHGGEVGMVVRGSVADGNVISGNRIYENDTIGVWLDAADARTGATTLVTGNSIYRNGQQGVLLTASGAIVDGNTVVNNGLAGLAGMSAIHVVGTQNGEAHGNVISNNIIAYQRDGTSYDGNGIQLDHWTDGAVVTGNQIFGNDGVGISVFAARNSLVQGNTVYGNMVDSGGTHVIAQAELFLGEALFAAGYTQGNVIAGNTIFATHPYGAAMQVQESVTTQSSNVINGNSVGRSGPGALWRWALEQGTSLDDWNALALVGTDTAATAPVAPAIDPALLDISFTQHSKFYNPTDLTYSTQIVAAPGRTDIVGGPNGSWISAGGLDATLSALGGDNQLAAGRGNVTLRGGPGHDTLFGGAGNHLIFGGSGNTIITGGSGSSLLMGGGGDDYIQTGNGTLPNTLGGGGGKNTLVGGDGVDTFVIGGGVDYIYYFTAGQDRLDVSLLGVPSMAELRLMQEGGHSIVLDKAGTVRALLVGVDATMLAPESFILTHNDGAAIVSITGTPAAMPEGNSGTTRYTFTVTRTGDTSVAHSVHWSASGIAGKDATPANADDFVGGTLPAGVLAFAPGQTSLAINVDVAGDSLLEKTETFVVSLAEPSSGVTIGTALGLGTIQNEDSQLDLLTPLLGYAEGQAGTNGTFAFTVVRTGKADGVASAHWFVETKPTDSADAFDFPGQVLPTGTVTFAAGDTRATILVPISGDGLAESDETFTLRLSDPSAGVSIIAASVDGTIYDDDVPSSGMLSVAAVVPALPEHDAGTTLFGFDITRSGDLSLGASVGWAIRGGGIAGTADADAKDFDGPDLPTGRLEFAPGQDVQTVVVAVAGDTKGEADETFAMVLSGPSAGAGLANASATAVIVNDDPIVGTTANEMLEGFDGADIFLLGGSRDEVIGKGGVDTFHFLPSAIGTATTNGTTLDDFDPKIGEKIDLSAIDAISDTEANDAFFFIGTAPFSGAPGELRWSDIGPLQLIEGNVDIDQLADLYIVVRTPGPVEVSWFVL